MAICANKQRLGLADQSSHYRRERRKPESKSTKKLNTMHSEIPSGNGFYDTYMGVGRIFSRGGQKRIFSNVFPGGPKVVKFVFYPSKLKKQRFFANNFENQGRQGPWTPGFDYGI